jgi:hypothetical protein
MRRRNFIAGLASTTAAWPFAARAQQKPTILRVGAASVQARTVPIYVAFLKGMAELGYEEGKNFIFEFECQIARNCDPPFRFQERPL